jgi:nucleotide-binding universal stress UspA family protein
MARRFDISVCGQPDPDTPAAEEIIAEALLFESGRPVIVVPYVQKRDASLNRVMVCWDGSRAATRAIADSIPFLKKANQVDIVMIASSRGKDDEVPGADLGQHLARHGVSVEVKRLTSPDIDITSTILSYAADTGADLIVMGGYGHSRLREFILGGVTRGILSSMTVPTLMSH